MVYVFDTSSFIVIGHYYPKQFPSFWNKFDETVDIGKIISVREVFRELDQDASTSHLSDWTEHHKSIFMIPNTAATQFVSTIFSVSHFQTLVSEKNRLAGRPCADPFIIALAKVMNACVVTEEKRNQTLQKYLMFVSISGLTVRTCKDSWKEKTGVSNTNSRKPKGTDDEIQRSESYL